MERRLRFRLGIFGAIILVVLVVFVVKLYDLQVVEAQNTSDGVSTYTTTRTVTAARGNILDRNGEVLVSNRASYDVTLQRLPLLNSESPNESLLELYNVCTNQGIEITDTLPLSVEPAAYTVEDRTSLSWTYFKAFLANNEWDPDMSAENIWNLLKEKYNLSGYDEQTARIIAGLRYELDLRTSDVVAYLEDYVVATDVTAEQLAAIKEAGIPGITVITTTTRTYNTTYAAHILGTLGSIPEDEVDEYLDNGYSLNAQVGVSGLEEAFEDYLRGVDGTEVLTMTTDGQLVDSYYSETPQQGNNVYLSIDINMQAIAEEALADHIQNIQLNGAGTTGEGQDARDGAVVVQDVKTGEILACASYPTYDLERYSDSEYYASLLADEDTPLVNRAFMTYPPGSVYKMVVAIAAMNAEMFQPYMTITCQGVYTRWTDYQPVCNYYTNTGNTHGAINLMQAISLSCNYYFYEVGYLMGTPELMDETAKALGLGEDPGAELASSWGTRANEETKAETYSGDQFESYESTWYTADNVAAAIGQSLNSFSPLQLVCYTSALANEGTRYKATFLSSVKSADYSTTIYENSPVVASVLEMNEYALMAYQEGMKMTASEGTAMTAFAASSTQEAFPIEVAAKTGTAQHGSGGSDNASFVCYAPADDPEIAIAIYVEHGAQGGALGTIAREILEYYFTTKEATETVSPENVVQ